jgi:hypothetical protein
MMTQASAGLSHFKLRCDIGIAMIIFFCVDNHHCQPALSGALDTRLVMPWKSSQWVDSPGPALHVKAHSGCVSPAVYPGSFA